MSAFNTVRFRVKPGREQDFIAAHRRAERNWPGLKRANLIKTGERTYAIIAEWSDMDALAANVDHAMLEGIDPVYPHPPVERFQPVVAQPAHVGQRCAGLPILARLNRWKSCCPHSCKNIVDHRLVMFEPEGYTRQLQHAGQSSSEITSA